MYSTEILSRFSTNNYPINLYRTTRDCCWTVSPGRVSASGPL